VLDRHLGRQKNRPTMANSVSNSEHTPAVKTLARAFQVLDLCLLGGPSISLAEVTRSLGWNKATAFRLCKALEQPGLLQRDSNGRFSLGPMALELGTAYLAANQTRSRAVHVAEGLSRRTGGTALVCSLVRGEVLVVLTVEGDTPLKAAARLGERMPVHATAAGKAIAASLPAAELDELIGDGKLPTFTPRTLSSPRRFRAELAKVRKDGFSLALDEYHDGVFSAAVALDRRLFGRPSALVAVLPSMLAPVDDPSKLVAELKSARAALDPFMDMRGAGKRPGVSVSDR
jgi:DNA-binding IclR family transcriptional regulator